MRKLTYLSNAVFAANDGYNIILTARSDDASYPTDAIILDPHTVDKLLEYVTEMRASEQLPPQD